MIVTRGLGTPVRILADYGTAPDGRRRVRIELAQPPWKYHFDTGVDQLIGTDSPLEVHQAADAAPKLQWPEGGGE